MLGKKLAIDLGSTQLRLWVKGDGVVGVEPALVALDGAGRVVGVGSGAAVTQDDHVHLPVLRAAAVVDGVVLRAAVAHLIGRAVGRQRVFRPDVVIAVPTALGGADRLAVLDAAARAGARTGYLVDAPMAAALGAGVPVASSTAHLVVDVGGDLADIAVLADQTTVVAHHVSLGGRAATAAVHRALRSLHIEVDEATAEVLKLEIGSVLPLPEERTLRVPTSGREAGNGDVVVSSRTLSPALEAYGRELATAVGDVLNETPARARADLQVTGLVLTGGGALLRGLDRLVGSLVGLKARVAPGAQTCAVVGAGAALDHLEVVRRNVVYVR